ncbi:hypothetical protein GMRT_10123 [Giardia muris]|uniref:Uncharacterized protein n=1 Tax=Giardia muris TaxID=5742 RepID=A0A4Z1T1H7_GIAMU|nr:hypothetical protein GMRT_10123 [Giardia muris]|eukprot:TNJ27773.1 hypothetical protein GMRT_10123 [Giardia muris]
MPTVSPELQQYLQFNAGRFSFNVLEAISEEDGRTAYSVAFFIADIQKPIPEVVLFTFYQAADGSLCFSTENNRYRYNADDFPEGGFLKILEFQYRIKTEVKT